MSETSRSTARTGRSRCGCIARRPRSTGRRRRRERSSTSTEADGRWERSTRSTDRVASWRRGGRGRRLVDYRLAPEHPFPVAVDEAAAAVAWVADIASSFGADPERLGVSGTSAGGTLALAAALYAREFGLGADGLQFDDSESAGPAIAGQFLLYPIAGHDFETTSYRENVEGPLLTRADMKRFFEQYLRSLVDARNPFAVPLRADDLGDLPSATVVTAGFDPLRDDGVALAERFEREGTPVEHRHYPAMAHGFCSLSDRVAAADSALSAVASDVRDRL